MKMLLSLLLALLMIAPTVAEDAPTVYVSITDDTGALVLACAPVSVTDADGNGHLTMNDALICAHETYYPDGAVGYLAEESEFGMSVYRLWGVENGGSYGYCINDAFCINPYAVIWEGVHVKAYAFTDLSSFTDLYGFFQAPTMTVKTGEAVEMTLSVNAFDENWSAVVRPVPGAALSINGEPAGVVTDDAGMALLTFDAPGVYTVSAASDTITLVAPVCIVTVEE